MKITKKSYEIQISNTYVGFNKGKEVGGAIFVSVYEDNQINIAATGEMPLEGIEALEQALGIAKAIAYIGFDNFEIIDKTQR